MCVQQQKQVRVEHFKELRDAPGVIFYEDQKKTNVNIPKCSKNIFSLN